MFGDKSPRTARITKNAVSVIVATVLIFVGLVGYVAGSVQYRGVVARSSSPIGTPLTFGRSRAEVTLKDIYTDKKKDVLIARISTSDVDTSLPYKGTDYKVFIASKSTEGLKEMPILFGRMSTDGDMFLIIPNPTQDVYSVFIMNTNYINSNVNVQTEGETADLESESITSALSSYDYDDDKNKTGSYTVENDNMDVVSFRLTANPAFDTAAYRPKVIDASLLDTSDDGESQSFNFELFFDKIFKEAAIKDLTKDYEKLTKAKNALNKRQRVNIERLAKNEDDAQAKSSFDSIKSQLSDIKSQQESLADEIAKYTDLDYDSSYFEDLQTKATIVKSK